MESIPIILADGQELTRLGLSSMIRNVDRFNIVKEVSNEDDLLFELTRQAPSIVILDYHSPTFSESTPKKAKRISPFSKILIVSGDEDKGRIKRLIEQGINNFISKHCLADELIQAIYATQAGEKFFCKSILSWLFEKTVSQDEATTENNLSNRERDIIKLIAQGLTAKQIAEELEMSTHTVFTHRKNIMKKLNFSTTSELILFAVNEGLMV